MSQNNKTSAKKYKINLPRGTVQENRPERLYFGFQMGHNGAEKGQTNQINQGRITNQCVFVNQDGEIKHDSWHGLLPRYETGEFMRRFPMAKAHELTGSITFHLVRLSHGYFLAFERGVTVLMWRLKDANGLVIRDGNKASLVRSWIQFRSAHMMEEGRLVPSEHFLPTDDLMLPLYNSAVRETLWNAMDTAESDVTDVHVSVSGARNLGSTHIYETPKCVVEMPDGDLAVVISRCAFVYVKDLYGTQHLYQDIFNTPYVDTLAEIVKRVVQQSSPGKILSAIPISAQNLADTLKRMSGMPLGNVIPSQIKYRYSNEYEVDLSEFGPEKHDIDSMRLAIIMINLLYFTAEDHPIRDQIYDRLMGVSESLAKYRSAA